MSMFTINGTVVGTFVQPGRKDDKGEVSDPKDKVQIFGDMPTQTGDTRHELVTLSCEDRRVYDALQGKKVSIPMGVLAPGKGQIIYFIPKGAKPVVEPESPPSIQSSPMAAGAGRAGQ
jgi:hypothetical protein